MEAWFDVISSFVPLESIGRLLMAIGAGAIIGWERETQDKPAGLRTHMLVALGAAVFMVGAMELSAGFSADESAVELDPMRALQGIIGGVGFLGAGTILESRGSVRGITTAASIWVVAAIGTCCGIGLYRLAITCSILALVVLWAIGLIEFHTFGKQATSKSK